MRIDLKPRRCSRHSAGILSLLLLTSMLGASPAFTPNALTEDTIQDIADFVEKVRTCRGVTAVSLGVVENGRTVMTRGFGTANVTSGRQADANTPFCIGSLSKAFTSTLLAMQLAAKTDSITWDTPLHCLPGSDISFSDNLRSSQATLRDLLAHKLGVPSYFAPLLVGYPLSTSREELAKRTRFMEPVAPFRTSFFYNNYMYSMAGYISELLAKGASWEASNADRIFKPANMTSSGYIDETPVPPGLALPYVYVNNTLYQVDTDVARSVHPLGPAGSIYSTAEDMTKWIQLHLAVFSRVDTRGGPPLPFPGHIQLDYDTVLNIWETYQAQMPEPPIYNAIYRPYFPVEDIQLSYAMGWMRALYRGYRKLYHTGGISTYSSLLQIFPDLKSGIFLSTSGPGGQSSGIAARLIGHYVADRLLGETPWLNESTACTYPAPWHPAHEPDNTVSIERETSKPVPYKASMYTGVYGHYGFGVIRIYTENNEMYMKYGRYGRARLLATSAPHHFIGTWLDKLWYVSNQDGTKLFQMLIFDDFKKDKARHLKTNIEITATVLTTFERDLDIDNMPPVGPRDGGMFVCDNQKMADSGLRLSAQWSFLLFLVFSSLRFLLNFP